jgi:hypothetical protein
MAHCVDSTQGLQTVGQAQNQWSRLATLRPVFFPVILTYNSSTLVAKARVALPVNIDICKLFFPSLESSQTHPQLSGEVILPQPARQSPSAPISVENRVAWKTVMLLSAGGLDTK